MNKIRSISSEIVEAVNHYSDEIVFNLAIASLLLNKSYSHDFTKVSLPKRNRPAFLWTIPMQSTKITLINYFNPPCHVHAPDIKYSPKKLHRYVVLSKVSALSKPLARFLIIILFNMRKQFKRVI